MSGFADGTDSQVFDDTFLITSIDDNKYDKVYRIAADNSSHDTKITLDINKELYPLSVGERFQMVLSTTLNVDGTKEQHGWRDLQRGTERTLADDFDYVMRGKLYRVDTSNEDQIKIYISFGGLILFMEGEFKKFVGLKIDYIYLLLKK